LSQCSPNVSFSMVRVALGWVLASLAEDASTRARPTIYFEETFTTSPWRRWTQSQEPGALGPVAPFEWTAGDWYVDDLRDLGLGTTQNLAHHAASAEMAEQASTVNKTLVVQFSVKHSRKQFHFCGGGYIKLFSDLNQSNLTGAAPYEIMFGPDICGYDVGHVHVIVWHKGRPKPRDEEVRMDFSLRDHRSHLYSLILYPDGRYDVMIDLKEVASGNVEQDWSVAGQTMADPRDKMPEDWVTEATIPDPMDVRPRSWPRKKITADGAERPPEWDDEEDGIWQAPLVDNPDYKGPWRPFRIENPEYKGEWKPRQIPHPNYVPFAHFPSLKYVGFELWTVNNGTIIDNIIVTDSWRAARQFAEEQWSPTFRKEKGLREAWDKAQVARAERAEFAASTAEPESDGEAGSEEEGDEDAEDEHDKDWDAERIEL